MMNRTLRCFCCFVGMALMTMLLQTSEVLQTSGAFAAQADDNALTTEEKRAGWILLFDGKNVADWKLPTGKTLPRENIQDGAINPYKSGGYIAYFDRKFGNYIFACDFKVSPSCNSGVFFRVGDVKNPVQTGIELQILDSAAKKEPGSHDCGAIYDIMAPSKNMMQRAGTWNHLEIECKDNLIKVRMNGTEIIDMDLNRWNEAGKNPDGTRNKFRTALKDMPRIGYIGFQDHGKDVWYKNIKIKPLTAPFPSGK